MNTIRLMVCALSLIAVSAAPPKRQPLPTLFVATIVVEDHDKAEDYTVCSYVAIGKTKEDVAPEVTKFLTEHYGGFKLRSLRVEPVSDELMDEFCAARLAAKRKASI